VEELISASACVPKAPIPPRAQGTKAPTARNFDWTATPHSPASGSVATSNTWRGRTGGWAASFETTAEKGAGDGAKRPSTAIWPTCRFGHRPFVVRMKGMSKLKEVSRWRSQPAPISMSRVSAVH
jgi:hypothetical protein